MTKMKSNVMKTRYVYNESTCLTLVLSDDERYVKQIEKMVQIKCIHYKYLLDLNIKSTSVNNSNKLDYIENILQLVSISEY